MSTTLIASLLKDRIFLVLLILWALNDHVFKYQFPSFWTGKLSDVTSLACTPVIMLITQVWLGTLITFLIGHTDRLLPESTLRNYSRLMAINALSMSVVMIGINTHEQWASAYCWGLGMAQWPFVGLKAMYDYGVWPPMPSVYLTMDSSDGWTAPATLISLWILRRSLPN